MGQNNRQRRSAKKRQRDARRRSSTPPSTASGPWAFGARYCAEHAAQLSGNDPTHGHDEWDYYLSDEFSELPDGRPPRSTSIAVTTLAALVDAATADLPTQPYRRRFLALPADDQRRALELSLHAGVERAVQCGWSPLDLYEIGRRRGDTAGAAYVIHVCAQWTGRFPAATVDRRWRDQLHELGGDDQSGEPSLQQWAADRAWSDVVAALTDLAVAVMILPVVEPVLPTPGTAIAAGPVPTGASDGVLRRVRGLLAKAEATEFEPEAAALSAKAQALMTRHSIDSAMAAVASVPSGAREVPRVRRVWLEAPYVRAKAVLVSQVATANRCRTALSENLGFVTLIGFDADLDTTDLLSTSLLVQATRAMRMGGSQRTSWGTSRTRSYRQSFLLSFASRIGERLSAAVAATETAADAEHGGSLLPVLVSREREVGAAFDRAFAHIRSLAVSVSDAAGWGAGRTAADLADLSVRPELDERSA